MEQYSILEKNAQNVLEDLSKFRYQDVIYTERKIYNGVDGTHLIFHIDATKGQRINPIIQKRQISLNDLLKQREEMKRELKSLGDTNSAFSAYGLELRREFHALEDLLKRLG